MIFSVIWDDRNNKYKVKRTAILSLEEVMNIYGSYKTEKEALTVCKGLMKRQERPVNDMKTIYKP